MSAPYLSTVIQQVFDHKGDVSPVMARLFLNAVLSGAVSVDEKTYQGLSALPIETKVGLYESIAKEKSLDNVWYFTAINAELGLPKNFYPQQAQAAESFFADPEKLEVLWQPTANKTNFADAFKEISMDVCSLEQTRKEQFIQYITATYASYCKLPPPKISFYEGPSSQDCYLSPGCFNINRKSSFLNKPGELFLKTIHEIEHLKQLYLARDYQEHKINLTDPHYWAARIFLVNFENYINPNTSYAGYYNQPVEVSARYSSEKAIEVAYRCLGILQQKCVPSYGYD